VFAALAISRRLQDQTGMSIKKVVRALRPIQQITLTIGGQAGAGPRIEPTSKQCESARRGGWRRRRRPLSSAAFRCMRPRPFGRGWPVRAVLGPAALVLYDVSTLSILEALDINSQ
jgi:hypothetical protein